MEWLRLRIRRHPRAALVLGKLLLIAGGILVLGAVFARASLMSLNAERAEAGLPALQTLAQAWPERLTAVVPEGPVGFAVAALLVIAGMVLTVLAGQTGGSSRR